MRAILFVALTLMMGCASQPEVRDVRPEVVYQEVDIGRGRAVLLSVTQSDQNNLLNQGLVDDDFVLAMELKRDVRAALFNFGFTTAHDQPASDLALDVVVDELTFVAGEDPVLTPVFLRNTIRFVLQKGFVKHTFSYSTQRTHKLGVAPSVSKSRELISQILSDTLQRAIQDPAFIAELGSDVPAESDAK